MKIKLNRTKLLASIAFFTLAIGAGVGATYAKYCNGKTKGVARFYVSKVLQTTAPRELAKQVQVEKTLPEKNVKKAEPVTKSSANEVPPSYNQQSQPKPTISPVKAAEKPAEQTPSRDSVGTMPSGQEPAVVQTPTQANPILDLINQARKADGLGQVRTSSTLTTAALTKAQDMQTKNYFSHTSPSGKTDFQFMKDAGYAYSNAASNIAMGSFSGDQDVFDGWMNSAGHRENILRSGVTEIGYAKSGQYYVLFLAKPM